MGNGELPPYNDLKNGELPPYAIWEAVSCHLTVIWKKGESVPVRRLCRDPLVPFHRTKDFNKPAMQVLLCLGCWSVGGSLYLVASATG